MKTEKNTTPAPVKKVNFNSPVNQSIKSKFIGQHVYVNVNQMAEYILQQGWEDQNAPFSFDDVENYYSYPEYIETFANFGGGTEDERTEEIERLRDLQSDLYDQILEDKSNEGEIEAKREKIEEEIAELENLENEPKEVFEWWMVSDFLCNKLKEKGCAVLSNENIWGRTTTGQAILLDCVISQICADMEILEGMANSWEEKRKQLTDEAKTGRNGEIKRPVLT